MQRIWLSRVLGRSQLCGSHECYLDDVGVRGPHGLAIARVDANKTCDCLRYDAPAAPFYLMLRSYLPYPTVFDGKWKSPRIKQAK